MAFCPIPQPRILEIEPYVPGESKSSAARVIRLAANENPFGTSSIVQEAFVKLSQGLHHYPDGGSQNLRRALAAFHAIDPDRIVCGTGSDEIITMLCKAFTGNGDEVLYSEFGFLMYPLAALAAGATPVKAPESNRATDLDALLDAVTDKTKIIFLANPNNPTGCLITRSEIISFREKLREDVLLVIDSAYAEFVTDETYTDGKDLVSRFDNVIMLRTFSKAYGLSGLRVGWSYSSTYIADILNRVRGVFNISVPAQVCAEVALSDQDFIKRTVENNTFQRVRVSAELKTSGVHVYPSSGNFVLFSLGSVERADACLSYLKERGILLRGMKAYNLPDCIRMTIGTPEDMDTVLQDLRSFLL
jgi:histidinol-phosphate aminotransferase